MYRYDEFDAVLVDQRVTQFRDQVTRRLSGELNDGIDPFADGVDALESATTEQHSGERGLVKMCRLNGYHLDTFGAEAFREVG